MNARSFILSAVAFAAVSPAFADASNREEPRPAAREQRLLRDLAAGMREIVAAVVPEISVPKLDLKLPTLDGR
jgi:hypothetical protein